MIEVKLRTIGIGKWCSTRIKLKTQKKIVKINRDKMNTKCEKIDDIFIIWILPKSYHYCSIYYNYNINTYITPNKTEHSQRNCE